MNPYEIELSEDAVAQLDAIAKFHGADDDPALLEAAGFDAAIFENFLSEIGQTKSEAAQQILEMRSAAEAAAQQHFRRA